jgi:hypothetical protein
MRISDIETVIANSEAHLLNTSTLGTRLESYLSGYLLVYVSSRFQIEVAAIVGNQLALNTVNTKIKNFIERSLARYFQSVNLDQLKNLLEYFGGHCKSSFISKIEMDASSRRASTMYSNLIVNRNSTAHTQGSQMTFKEVKEAYIEGNVVLDYFRDSIA